MTESIEQLLKQNLKELGAGSKSGHPTAIEKMRRLLRETMQLTQQPLITTFVGPSNLEEFLKIVDNRTILGRGRYTIDFDITITSNGRLEIEPGTEIVFGEKGGILAYGVLLAVGGPDKRIIFMGQEDPWRNISFAGRYSSTSRLAYCTIKGGRGREEIKSESYFGGFECPETPKGRCGGAILIAESSPTIRDCLIQGNNAWYGGGIFMQSSGAVIVENEITHNVASYHKVESAEEQRKEAEEVDRRIENLMIPERKSEKKPFTLEPSYYDIDEYYGAGGGIYVGDYCNPANIAGNVLSGNLIRKKEPENIHGMTEEEFLKRNRIILVEPRNG